MKIILRISLLFVLLLATAPAAKAFGPCGSTFAHNGIYVSKFWNTNRSVYQAQYTHYADVGNNSGHTCHIVYEFRVTTNNGWRFQYRNGSPSIPNMSWNPVVQPCAFNDSPTQHSVTCSLYLTTGSSQALTMFWELPSNCACTDTSTYTVYEHSDSDGSDYVIGNGSVSVY